MFHQHDRARNQTFITSMLAWLLFIFTACPVMNAADFDSGRRLAIVVGVNSYRANSGLGALKHAAKDAHRLSAVLQKSGFTVIEMTHDVSREPGKEVFAPNLDLIRDQISGVLDFPNLGANDSILITLHGHGVHYDLTEKVTRKGQVVEQKTPKFFFCPADASIQQIETANDIQDKNRLLPLDEIYESFGSCRAGTKLLIVDACRNDPNSSNVFRDGEVRSLTMPKLAPPPGGMVAFLSCRENQRAVEDPELGQGVFTHFLVQGLEGKADQPLAGEAPDGIVTLSELTTYTANNTYAFVFKKHNGLKQSPEIKGEFDANLPLVRLAITPTILTSPFSKSQARTAQDAWAKHLGVKLEFTNKSGLELVLIPPGEYARGTSVSDVAEVLRAVPQLAASEIADEQPQHQVRITKPLFLAKYEVTQGQFEKLMGRNPAYFSAAGSGRNAVSGMDTNQFPIEQVNWFDGVEFCNKLSEAEGKSPCYELLNVTRTSDQAIKTATVHMLDGNGYRLPSEAEWEYACRSGTTTPFYYGSQSNGKQANVDGNYGFAAPKGPSLGRTCRVGQYAANNFGLFDMTGNVWEWCQDGYNDATYREFSNRPAVDPVRSLDAPFHVNRGGSFLAGGWAHRSAARWGYTNEYNNSFGFRVACQCAAGN